MTDTLPTADSSDIFYAILGEPIPKNTQLLRTAEEYRHFRTIYSSQKQLNRLFSEASLKTEIRLVMIDRTSEIPRKLWDLSHATCVIIFGPNFPWLSVVERGHHPFVGFLGKRPLRRRLPRSEKRPVLMGTTAGDEPAPQRERLSILG